MTPYSATGRELLACEIVAHLRTLTPGDVAGSRRVARLLADADISRAMAESPFLAVGTRREQLEFALSGARVDLEAGCDQETLDWNTMVLTQAAAPVPRVCLCGRPARECTEGDRTGQVIQPDGHVEAAPLRPLRGEG